jgi:enoyl-CoA hydratase/carnithine racemase
MNEHVTAGLSNGVLSLRLNRPQKKNALTSGMYNMLADSIDAAGENPQVRVILVLGHAAFFTSGNDLADPPNGLEGALGRFIQAIITCGKPMIAAPSGLAVGIGVTMLAYFDLVYCADNAQFTTPFVSLGVCPELGSSYTLVSIMGYQRAAELLLAGGALDARKACAYGLVNDVLPADQLESFAVRKAEAIAAQPPNATQATKRLMRRWNLDQAQQANRVEMDTLMALARGAESREAIQAFFEKRPPNFEGLE